MDEMKWEILEDGTISIKTDEVSEANHYSADELITGIVEDCGGVHNTEKNNEAKAHAHHHSHNHSHAH